MYRACVAAVLSSVVCLAFPREATGQRVRMGVRTGLNFATWGGADVNDFEAAIGGSVTTRTGLTAGALVAFPLGGPISLEPELLFISKGAKIEISGSSGTLNMGYIEVPVLLVIAPRVQGSVRPAILAGGAIAFKLSCGVSGGGTSDNCSNQGLDTKSTDYGVVFGGQLGFGLGTGELQVDVRYNLGLGGVFDSSPSVAINNRGLMLTAAYLFRSGR
jgi:hypothetical protein